MDSLTGNANDAIAHNRLQLVSTDEKFYLVPTSDLSAKVLEIDRLNYELALVDRSIVTNGEKREICLLLGIIRLLACPYLLVGTSHKEVGMIGDHHIYEMTNFDIIPFTRTTIHLSHSQEQDNRQMVAMLQRVLSTPGFYYSFTYELTLCEQRKKQLAQQDKKFWQLPLHEKVDERFVWNTHLTRNIAINADFSRYVVPLLHGFVSIKTCTINKKRFKFVIISRRSCYRAGVRYYVRGVDDEGHAANFVETEQLVVYEGIVSSFVQTRGSIPLHWSQKPNIRYKPKPQIQQGVEHEIAMQRHFDEQIAHYGQQVLINLIDQKGPEKLLGEMFQRSVTLVGNILVNYDAFDFHKECSRMRWHRLSILITRLAPQEDQFGYYMANKEGVIQAWQGGVFRTNCIDCLDRTNVVQSMLARRSLQAQLQAMHVMTVGERIEDKTDFEYTFKNVWADNADCCARQYAGTGALKTDFTRTGKRTRFGLLKDGYNSMIRYYYNNFSDGFRQDSIDLFLGNYVVDQWRELASPSPLQNKRSWLARMLPFVMLVGLSMLFLSIIIPISDPQWQLFYILFWSAVVVGVMVYVYLNGTEFVDAPKLTHRKNKLQ